MLKILNAKTNLLQPLKTSIKILVSNVHNRSTSNHNPLSNPAIDFILNEVAQDLEPLKPSPSVPPEPRESVVENVGAEVNSRVQVSHPWPEWVELMDKLIKGGFFDEIGHPFGKVGTDSKDVNQIRTACLNFARLQPDLIRFLSRKDIQIVAGSGCPSIDRKVVNSGKRLRAHVGINEGNVCSSCILRGNCERAYVMAQQDEGGRTIDVLRFLVTYALDAVIGSVENKPCLNKKVKESVRKLLKEIVEFGTEEPSTEQLTAATSEKSAATEGTSAHQGDQTSIPIRQGDWTCPRCNFLNFTRNIKCLQCNGLFQEKVKKLNEELNHLPLKKGDWICNTCNFLNFARNTRCLQCKEKPPQRQLNPGEWECESCNYINFKRNMVCLKCDHKRPKALHSRAQAFQTASNNMHRTTTRPFFGQERQCRDEGDDKLKFVDGEEYMYSCKISGQIDFPIIGGRSDLSKNVEKHERWRKEMAEQSKSAAKARENADAFKSSIIRSSNDLFRSADDEEMADWFGHEKNTDKSCTRLPEIHIEE